MRSLSYYVLRQIVGPFLLFTLLMTIVVWLTQSVRLLDMVINRSQSVVMFAYLSALILPSLLTVIVPIAFFAGALYALHRLNNDSELMVMWAAGFSRLQLAIPLLAGAVCAMAISYLCNMYLMPLSEREIKNTEFDLRADIGAAILHEGSFTTPADGLTMFIREIASNGEIRGLLVHDNRNPKRPLTYLAESGALVETPNGARLIMQNGAIEQSEPNAAMLSVLKFDKYVFNLQQFGGAQRDPTLDVHARYLTELFNPDLKDPRQVRNYNAYIAEAHNRISAPFYAIAFALIALAAAARGRMARMNYTLRLLAASLLAASLRLAGYGVHAMAVRHPEMIAFLYIVPLGGATVATASFFDLPIFTFMAKPRLAEDTP